MRDGFGNSKQDFFAADARRWTERLKDRGQTVGFRGETCRSAAAGKGAGPSLSGNGSIAPFARRSEFGRGPDTGARPRSGRVEGVRIMQGGKTDRLRRVTAFVFNTEFHEVDTESHREYILYPLIYYRK